MRALNIVGYVVAAILVFFGVLFIMASYASFSRFFVGVILIAAGLVIVLGIGLREKQNMTVVQKLELPGQLDLEEIKCRNCGATLDAKAVTIQAETLIIKCPYCGKETAPVLSKGGTKGGPHRTILKDAWPRRHGEGHRCNMGLAWERGRREGNWNKGVEGHEKKGVWNL